MTYKEAVLDEALHVEAQVPYVSERERGGAALVHCMMGGGLESRVQQYSVQAPSLLSAIKKGEVTILKADTPLRLHDPESCGTAARLTRFQINTSAMSNCARHLRQRSHALPYILKTKVEGRGGGKDTSAAWLEGLA